ncbi:hypothetical protein KSP40_PGU014705 [Platanthera guangdongensis]|uniref:Pentatricopeptide repeat-containing protein n=1 Tax=Platanthera guangdongensis TaxID=2320717 RepID=A0ABR2LRN6_9ASPA
MPTKGIAPDLVSYTNLVNGLCARGELDKANGYLVEMVGKGITPHFSVFHALVMGFCNAGKHEEGCGVMEVMLSKGVVPHLETWMYVVAAACEDYSGDVLDRIIMKIAREEEWRRSTRIVQAVPLLDDVIGRLRKSDWRRV